jgi:hypothetical protein
METHVKILAALKIALGAIMIIVGMLLFALFGGIAGLIGASASCGRDERLLAVPILGGIGALILVVLLVLAIPDIVAGIGLLYFKPWARILMLVLCALGLLNFPLGTGIGVYGLWVLLDNRTTQLFEGRRT